MAIELVIVDDASSDESCSLACDLVARDRDYFARALVVRHDARAGPAGARDTGMRLSTAAAALLLDVDNVIYPRCVKRCLDALKSSSAAFVYPILRVIGSGGGLLGCQQFDRDRLSRGNYIDNLVMVRRSVWADVGGFPNLFEGLEDYGFWLTLIDHGYAGAQFRRILGAYRRHKAGRTESMLLHLDAIHERLERAFPWIRLSRTNSKIADRPVRMVNDDRDRYIDLMIRILTNTIYEDPSTHPDLPAEFNSTARVNGQDWPKTAHTMAGATRLQISRSW